jgi:phage replication-related protein YjqB (UPF0714/DUF867 family)
MSDQYECFKQLESGETKKVDYDIRTVKRDSPVASIAPHGGHIEPHTTLIAEKIASDLYSFYTFMGLRPGRPHGDLHIKSHKFNESDGLKLVSSSDFVVAIHGRADNGDPATILMGGLDSSLRDAIAEKLKEAGFATRLGTGDYAGVHRENICNRGRTKHGVQLEMPRSLRNLLEQQPNRLTEFASAINTAIESRL